MDFELVRIAIAIAMLGIASFLDLRKREVSDLLWVAFGVIAGIIYIFDFPTSTAEQAMVGMSLALTTGISFGIYKSGLFGGADALCLVVLAAIVPTYDGQMALSQVTFHPITPLIVLSNAIILSLFGIVVNIAKNFAYARNSGSLFAGLEHESPMRKTVALLIGHRMKEQPRYAFPIETTIGGKRRFDFALKSAENAEYETQSDVWVMSGMPLLVYMLTGFIVMLLAGDLMALVLSVFRLT
jgi:preflagellin peptidase FlaK